MAEPAIWCTVASPAAPEQKGHLPARGCLRGSTAGKLEGVSRSIKCHGTGQFIARDTLLQVFESPGSGCLLRSPPAHFTLASYLRLHSAYSHYGAGTSMTRTRGCARRWAPSGGRWCRSRARRWRRTGTRSRGSCWGSWAAGCGATGRPPPWGWPTCCRRAVAAFCRVCSSNLLSCKLRLFGVQLWNSGLQQVQRSTDARGGG